jgi:hypothetical protein
MDTYASLNALVIGTLSLVALSLSTISYILLLRVYTQNHVISRGNRHDKRKYLAYSYNFVQKPAAQTMNLTSRESTTENTVTQEEKNVDKFISCLLTYSYDNGCLSSIKGDPYEPASSWHTYP